MVPNFVTGIRVICSLLLLCVSPFSESFLFLYGVCGISDVADGYIARKTNKTSQFGATLDSVADALYIAIVLLSMIKNVELPVVLLIWIFLIAAIRISSLIIGFFKYHTVAFLHTYANKATGFLLFIFPIFYAIGRDIRTAYVICLVATLSAIEELLINLWSSKLDREQKSIFSEKRNGNIKF